MSLSRHPSLLSLPGLACACVLAYGAFNRVEPEPSAGVPLWTGDSFASLAWLGVIALVVVLLVASRYVEARADALAFVGLGAQALLASAVLTISLAVAAECQNYWDAYHFSALAWCVALSAAISLGSVMKAASLGSELALSLRVPALAAVLLSALGWMWTWSTTLQALISDIGRFLFLATHG